MNWKYSTKLLQKHISVNYGGMSLESISEKEQLLLPVLLRVFLKCYLNVDSMTAQGYLQNPSLIPNDRLRDTVNKESLHHL